MTTVKFNFKKILKYFLIAIVSLIIVVVIGVFTFWRNEISSLMSIEMLIDSNTENKSAPVYIMDVKGGYYFDKFVEQGGASDDDELIRFVVDNITKGIILINIASPDIGCSSFTGVDINGDRYFGRNYDFSTSTGLIVRTDPGDGRYASISSVDLQFLGIKDGVPITGLVDKFICLAAPYAPLDGINEAGVSCGIYMSYQGKENEVISTNQSTDKPDLTSTTMLRLILDYAGSVDEAVELVSKYDLHDSANTSFHYMVADSTGRSAILEWVNATDSHKVGAEAFIKAVEDLNSKMNIPSKIADIIESDIPEIARQAQKEANPLYPVPKIMTKKELESFYYDIADWSK